jgi:3'5'-cyclic nucleotide phosphodiesterase
VLQLPPLRIASLGFPRCCLCLQQASSLTNAIWLQVFGLLLAAIVHDIGHPGLTNDFLAKTNDPLAAAHGATSVNERHHLATAFSIAANEDTNVFAGLSPAEEQQVDIIHRQSITWRMP